MSKESVGGWGGGGGEIPCGGREERLCAVRGVVQYREGNLLQGIGKTSCWGEMWV